MHEILVPNDENINRVVDVLCEGGVVAFPTETVYGLGANAYNDKAVSKIFSYKKRPRSKPLSVCYQSFDSAFDDVVIDERAVLLAKKFLPGPVTIILKRRADSKLSPLCSAELDTVGIRVPSNPIALGLLSRLPFPLAAPSANRSTQSSPTTAQHVSDSLKDNKTLLILNGGCCSIGVESTIVDLPNNKVTRVGVISEKEIWNALG
ncbi:MAG: threonylcarbamoyl-AMP synthase [Holosporaceae bacterium]|jgi:L-threonylcarbamoyladenylate synthase|nr:threonylcarbamoyl-AMP synthase [Holosporaceae bacterium]